MEAFVISEKWDKDEYYIFASCFCNSLLFSFDPVFVLMSKYSLRQTIYFKSVCVCVLAFHISQHHDDVVWLCKINRKTSTSISIWRHYYLHSPDLLLTRTMSNIWLVGWFPELVNFLSCLIINQPVLKIHMASDRINARASVRVLGKIPHQFTYEFETRHIKFNVCSLFHDKHAKNLM